MAGESATGGCQWWLGDSLPCCLRVVSSSSTACKRRAGSPQHLAAPQWTAQVCLLTLRGLAGAPACSSRSGGERCSLSRRAGAGQHSRDEEGKAQARLQGRSGAWLGQRVQPSPGSPRQSPPAAAAAAAAAARCTSYPWQRVSHAGQMLTWLRGRRRQRDAAVPAGGGVLQEVREPPAVPDDGNVSSQAVEAAGAEGEPAAGRLSGVRALSASAGAAGQAGSGE